MRAPDAPPESEAGSAPQLVDWNGGTLDDLVSLLSGPAWSARVEVLAPNGGNPAGEVHVIAGGVSDAIFEGKSTHDALDRLRAVKGARFRVEPRLPNPSDGDLTFPGPDHGKLEERPLAHLMRYCEDYVLTAGIEVWRGSENAKVEYRRGEISGVTVGGIDAPERLAEVMKWSSGSYRLLVPKLTLPETAPKAAVPAVITSRASGASSKTIFGMPALDPAALAAVQAQAKIATSPTSGPSGSVPRPTAATPSAPSSVAAPSAPTPSARGGGTPVVPAVAAAPVPQPTVPAQGGAMSKTIFGVQPPISAAASPATTPPAAAAPAPAKPAPEPVKVARTATPTPSPVTTASMRPTAPAPVTAPVAMADRTAPTKAPPRENSGETPMWTYVGVGFVFGLALLGVYRLVIVLAH